MPVRDHPPHKKRKADASSGQTYHYTSPSEIRRVFNAQSESGLIEGLTALRNQLTINQNQLPIQPNDQRLLLAKAWLEDDPGAHHLFAAWEAANSRQSSLLSVIVGLLSALLSLLSSHYTYHSHALPILRTLLSQQYAHNLNLYLSGHHAELILSTLKLFNSISDFAGGSQRKPLLDVFAWEIKSLPKLLHMRRKSKASQDVDMLARPDIRTLYILLVLSFVDATTPSAVKAAFLEQHRDAFTSIFKGLWQDPYSIIRRVLEVSWSGLCSDPKLKRTLKILIFNESILSQLLRMYDRNLPEDKDSESVPADVVHHFLLALCTRPGVGLCFHDRGWYPRETDADQRGSTEVNEHTEDEPRRRGGKIYNKILANVLKTLKVNEDPRQQELALKILAACPELVSGYWSSAGLALEPRLSSKWLANIAFFGTVVSLPVPRTSFLLPESGSTSTSLYQPSPPPLSLIVENILPTAHIKTHLSRGLQGASPLVQHATALALAKSLLKYEKVTLAFHEVERALEEDEEEGLWARRRREVEREIRKRVPEFQVVVGFSQRLNEATVPAPVGQGNDKQRETVSNPTRTALLAESAHRLLWLYHRLLPSVVAEARFDAGKLLPAVEGMLSRGNTTNPTRGLDTLRQLHVLRLLKESEQFTWAGKSGPKHSNFHILLKTYVITPVPAVRAAIVELLRHILSPGVLFQHDADEIALWLDSLPLGRRAPGAQAPDGALLTDEGDSVIPFLDDCVQRCVKTPYKYVEELQAMYASARQAVEESHTDVRPPSIGQHPEAFPSPLLATVVEQLGAKLRGKLLSPSDTLALFSFVRKLLLRTAEKSADLVLVSTFVAKVTALAEGQTLFPDYPVMEAAVRREVVLLTTSIEQLQNPSMTVREDENPAVHEFLSQVEKLVTPNLEDAQEVAAYELVDWVRLIGPQLHPAELDRLILAIKRLHKPALRELFQHLDPRSTSLWQGASVAADFSGITPHVGFDVLFLYSPSDGVEQDAFRNALISELAIDHYKLGKVRRAIRLILHRLAPPTVGEQTARDLLRLLAGIVQNVKASGKTAEATAIVSFCLDLDDMRSLCRRAVGGTVREGLSLLLDACFEVAGGDGRQLFSDNTGHWLAALRGSQDNMDRGERETALLWFKYMDAQEVIVLLDCLADRATYSSSASTLGIISDVLEVTTDILLRELDAVTHALPIICCLYSSIPQSPRLASLIAIGTRGLLPLGHDGYLFHRPSSERFVASLVSAAAKRWSLRRNPVPRLSVESFLANERMSDASVDIVTNLLYLNHSSRAGVADWLVSARSDACSATHLVRILFAFFDSMHGEEDTQAIAFQAHFHRVVKVVAEARHSKEICSMAVDCTVSMLSLATSERTTYLKALEKSFTTMSTDQLSPYALVLGKNLMERFGAQDAQTVVPLFDLGLRWAMRYLASTDPWTESGHRILSYLVSLILAKVPVKAHLAEPVIAAVIQDRLVDEDAVKFARLLASSTHYKPVTVNRFLQTMVQHIKFYEYCAISSSGQEKNPRDDIVAFLHTLFYLHPSNTCQPSHIEPLRKVYGGSLGAADVKILSVFYLFEITRKTSITSLFSQWSTSLDISLGTPLETLHNLDPSRVLKTCLEFPNWRTLTMDVDTQQYADQLYDPIFLLLLFAQALADSAPTSALAWVQLFRTNVVSLVLRTLSAKNAQLRELAWAQLAALYKAVKDADLQEKPNVLYILNLIKDISASAPSDEVSQLPVLTTLLLAHALRGVFYPSNFIYPLTARFLLQRPTLDPTDVPMLYGMLYSASEDWKKERAWIVRFLSDAMVGSDEWRIMKRRHTWDLLASLFQSEERDRILRRGVLEVLANVTCNARATTALILKHALLAWIEMQLQILHVEEAIAWIRIIENILVVVDANKVESATGGEWRMAVSRCMEAILLHPMLTEGVYAAAVPVLLRLYTLPGRLTTHAHTVLKRALHLLAKMEAESATPVSDYYPPPFNVECGNRHQICLHRSQRLFEDCPTPSIALWGECIEALWRVTMMLPSRTEEWDELSSRLLLWRTIAGSAICPLGEWTRREVLENIVLPNF